MRSGDPSAGQRPARRGRPRRRRQAVAGVLASLLGTAGVVAVAHLGPRLPIGVPLPTASRTPSAMRLRPAQAPPLPSPNLLKYPSEGAGTYTVVEGNSRTAGRAGTLLRFRVAVEDGITGLDPAEFAATVTDTLADPQSWTAGGAWRLQRVGPGQPYDFTIYLATPVTRDRLCDSAYDRYTSCRNGDSVVINVARWIAGVPDYGAPLAVYRQYVINHEVGHRLGYGHELCLAPDRPAPVMQQQTLGLHDCAANPWPYLDGSQYGGPPGEYDDPVPSDS